MEAESAKSDICFPFFLFFYFDSQWLLVCRFRQCSLTAATSTLPSRPPAAHPGSHPMWAIVKMIMITASTITAITAGSAIRDRRLREAVFWNEAFWKRFFRITIRICARIISLRLVFLAGLSNQYCKLRSELQKVQSGPSFNFEPGFCGKRCICPAFFSKNVSRLNESPVIYIYKYYCTVWNADVSPR